MMRRTVGLTARGKGMLVCGLAVGALGVALDSFAALAAGVFTVVLLGLAAGWVLLLARRTTCQRTSIPTTLHTDERFQVAAAVQRPLAGHGHVVRLLPQWAAGNAPGDGAVRLRRGLTQFAVVGTAGRRGLYAWPAMTLWCPDPLGAVRAAIRTSDSGRTVVFPRIEPLGSARVTAIPGGVSELDDAAVPARRALSDVGANPIPRPFRTGDSLRRMHWPATARTGEPMVRAEDAAPIRRAVVLLDTGEPAYRSTDGFERAVSAAASIAVRLLRLGWAVSLRVPGGGCLTPAAWVEGRGGETVALTALAGVTLADGATAAAALMPDDPVDAAFAVTGGGRTSQWPMPAMTTIRTEAGDHRDGLVWDGSEPLSAVWTADASRLVSP